MCRKTGATVFSFLRYWQIVLTFLPSAASCQFLGNQTSKCDETQNRETQSHGQPLIVSQRQPLHRNQTIRRLFHRSPSIRNSFPRGDSPAKSPYCLFSSARLRAVFMVCFYGLISKFSKCKTIGKLQRIEHSLTPK